MKRAFEKAVFSDVRRAYAETLKNEKERLGIVQWILIGWSKWISLLNREKQDRCFNLAMEAQADLEASVYLALSGFVKQSLQVLRSWLELSLLGIWFGYNKDAYLKWMYDQPEAPFARRGFFRKRWLVDLLNKTPTLKETNTRYQLADRLVSLYSRLSASTHTRGLVSFETIGRNKPVAAYNPRNFAKWYMHFWETYSLVSSILLLRFPKVYAEDSPEWEHIVSGMKGSDLNMVKSILT